MNEKYKCAMYLRLSQEDINKGNYNEESSSISSQRMIIQSFSKFNNLEIIDEYVDDGYSGGNFDRPEFKRLIEDIELKKINCVITKDLSRLGREIYTTGTYIEQYFLEKNVRYIAINDSYDSEIGDSMLGLRLSVNDLYLRDVSKKVRSALKIKQENGDYIGTYPCYGYKKDPSNHHHLIKDKNVEHIIKKIYEMTLAGYGIYEICDKLTKEQVPIPIVYKNEKRGKLVEENNGFGIWKYSTVKNILTSQMYIGNMVQHTYSKISYRSKKLRKIKTDDFIIVKGTHEAIINKDDFEKVQEILNNRSRFIKGKEQKYLFTGIILCKECGHTISISERKNKKGNHHYTQCNLYRKKGKYGLCTQHRLNYTLLEEDLLFILRDICQKFLDQYDFNSLTLRAKQINIENNKNQKINLDKIEKEIFKVQSVIDNLYMDKFNKLIDQETFKRLFMKEQKLLKSLNKNKIEIENNLSSLKLCKKEVIKFMSMSHPTHKEISRLVKKVTISEHNNIDLYFNFKELSFVEN